MPVSFSELISESLSLQTIQPHVNEVTVIHTWINTVEFWMVISKHGTGHVDTGDRLRKGSLLWFGISWVIGLLEDADAVHATIKLKENGDEWHNTRVIYLINVIWHHGQ